MAEAQDEPKTKLRFIGSYNHTMDAKGRMVIPQVFRDQLGDTFCIAPSLDFSSIAIYPNEKWEERSHAYEKLGKLNPGLNQYLEQFYAMSYDNQTCDGQGRVLLPANLRQKVLKDDREVEITGAHDYVRVVTAVAAADAWEKFRSELPDLLEMIGRLEQQNADRE
ncbi:MAG: hypothetical protein MJ142_01650 [Clostridia bacterium]|nr:hypothetical protein [Clostridia bacterium]